VAQDSLISLTACLPIGAVAGAQAKLRSGCGAGVKKAKQSERGDEPCHAVLRVFWDLLRRDPVADQLLDIVDARLHRLKLYFNAS
jgi:hypothetical protein